jgi:hypothetical protein
MALKAQSQITFNIGWRSPSANPMSYFEQFALSAHPSKVRHPQLLQTNILTIVQACENHLRSVPCVIGYPKLAQPAFLVFSCVCLYLAAQNTSLETSWMSRDIIDTFMTLPSMCEYILNQQIPVDHGWRTCSLPELLKLCHHWTLGIFQTRHPYHLPQHIHARRLKVSSRAAIEVSCLHF